MSFLVILQLITNFGISATAPQTPPVAQPQLNQEKVCSLVATFEQQDPLTNRSFQLLYLPTIDYNLNCDISIIISEMFPNTDFDAVFNKKIEPLVRFYFSYAMKVTEQYCHEFLKRFIAFVCYLTYFDEFLKKIDQPHIEFCPNIELLYNIVAFAAAYNLSKSNKEFEEKFTEFEINTIISFDNSFRLGRDYEPERNEEETEDFLRSRSISIGINDINADIVNQKDVECFSKEKTVFYDINTNKWAHFILTSSFERLFSMFITLKHIEFNRPEYSDDYGYLGKKCKPIFLGLFVFLEKTAIWMPDFSFLTLEIDEVKAFYNKFLNLYDPTANRGDLAVDVFIDGVLDKSMEKNTNDEFFSQRLIKQCYGDLSADDLEKMRNFFNILCGINNKYEISVISALLSLKTSSIVTSDLYEKIIRMVFEMLFYIKTYSEVQMKSYFEPKIKRCVHFVKKELIAKGYKFDNIEDLADMNREYISDTELEVICRAAVYSNGFLFCKNSFAIETIQLLPKLAYTESWLNEAILRFITTGESSEYPIHEPIMDKNTVKKQNQTNWFRIGVFTVLLGYTISLVIYLYFVIRYFYKR
ncbi:hypothetical protein CWI38_0082p0050 [Hamiltosporidium tvaerminnensis]|uniref:Uncharacterized protein n=1 Tax=Hamiltosporidium tvaerminnensis TaxID=1176355 RepID=A0A4Q9M4A9_9MICR|nr:hypothetical protein CWI38_0082p0050 [Hamiltosporidium tvaerminnensis]